MSGFFHQNTMIELYNASSTDLLKLWKMKGKINRDFDPYLKSYIHTLLFPGASIMSIPNQERQLLQIQNSFLLFQFILINQKNFYIELNTRDINHNKQKMKIPINNYPLNIWTNLLIDAGSLYKKLYQISLKYIDGILITGNIKIRKIYSLKNKNEMLPKSLDLGKNIIYQNYFLDDINSPYLKINLKFSEQQIKKETSNSPLKIRQLSPLRIENKNNNIYSMNEKTKQNIEFAKRIPDLTRLKNEINYGLKINPNGVGSIRNINKIIGYNLIENLENFNIVKTPVNKRNKKRDNSSRKIQKSMDKYNYNYNNIYTREINEIIEKNKSINPVHRNKNKFINGNSKKQLLNKTSNNNNNKTSNNNNKISNNNNDISNNDINIYKYIDNAKNNINRIVYHNDTLYNYGKKNTNVPKYLSYGIPIQSINNSNNNQNLGENNELILPKIEKNTLQLPIIKSSIQQQQNLNNIENNNKYGNFEILLDSALLNNSKVQAQLYDSIEEESCLINNNINSTLIDGSKMEDKIIKIDQEYNMRKTKNINNNNNYNDFSLSNTELPNISNLINDDTNNSNRPYTPPLSKLVPLNQSRNIKNTNNFADEINISKNKKNPNNISYAKILKTSSDNLIYDEAKGCFYNPQTNIYYDIKNLL